MATIKDIAEKAKISSSSVSRILNEDATLHVADQTKQRVFKIAEELHYTKKGRAKKIKDGHTIGILHWYTMRQELEDPYYLTIRMGVENYCRKHSLQVKRSFQDDSDFAKHIADVDGLVCIGKFSKDEVHTFHQLQSNIVFADMQMHPISENCITLDFKQAIIDMITYLLAQGHTHIAYVGGKEYTTDGQLYDDLRRSTFSAYCTLHAIKHTLLEEHYTIASGYRLMKQLLQKQTLPDALVCASDAIALGAMRACHEANIRIPKDISIIGFNDIKSAAYATPPLTTMHAPSEAMGEYAAQIVHQQIGKMQTLPMQYVLPCTMIKRASVKENNMDE